ncbi:putative leucine-rich repeat protein [Trypanosoma grayi]|uniref:putative leucine-rich repeat protein n=1 Tax=Trypanosoma grayi TaxID=71804 RepID=UPI0004F40C33|nr:putative leucine-rich repeat protein [Trypanosoma grayi]KEG06753.1 putative leucine-rich repeat protein [Trypanosoma grayi]
MKIVRQTCKHLTDVSPLASTEALEEVDLSGCEGLKIVGSLGRLPALRELDLGCTAITDGCLQGLNASCSLVRIALQHCRHLTDVSPLASIETLEEVDLSGCEGVRTVDALGRLPVLRELDLRCTAITDSELQGLSASRSLVKIVLPDCRHLTDVSPLASIKTLEGLILSGCEGVRTVGALGRLPALRELDLGCTAITDEELQGLSASHRLMKIVLCNCKHLTDVSPLASIKTLEEVDLSGCEGVRTVGALGRLPILRELVLGCGSITDGELQGLSVSRSLVRIFLADCKHLTDVSPLASIKTLEEVDLSGCEGVGTVGALGSLPVLRELDLGCTAITDEELQGLSASRSLVKIVLRTCKHLTDVSPLASIKTLEEVDLSGCEEVRSLGALGRLPILRVLDVGCAAFTDEELRCLSASRSLVKIVLQTCKHLTDVSPLASIETLEEVDLSVCEGVEIVDDLGRLPVLRELVLRCTAITDEELQGLSASRSLVSIVLPDCRHLTDVSSLASIKTLEEVDLSGCEGLRTVGALGRLPALRELDLGCTAITDEELQGLSASQSLMKIVLPVCRHLTEVSPLASIKTLEEVDLSGCEGLRTVGALGRLPALRELDLGCTAITDEELQGLSASHSLMKIVLCNCKHLTDVSPLASIKTLEEVDLSGCEGVRTVGDLGRLPVLRELDLGPLASIKTLEEVDLSGCEGVGTVGALGRLPALRELFLGCTAITDGELQGLSASRSLVKIVLQTCKHLTEVSPLASIKTLEEVDLSGCEGVGTVGALGRLPALRELFLGCTAITDGELQGLSASRSLVKFVRQTSKHLTEVSCLASIETLEEVYLSGYKGARTVGALGRLPALRILFFRCTSITNWELQGLSASRSLVKIVLQECNDLTDVSPLASIETLEELVLSDCEGVRTVGVRVRLLSVGEFLERVC